MNHVRNITRAMRMSWFVAALLAGASVARASAASDTGFVGTWNLTVKYSNETLSTALSLTERDGGVHGTSGGLDDSSFLPLEYQGSVDEGGLKLVAKVAPPVGQMLPQPVGTLVLQLHDGALMGRGTLYHMPVEVTGARPDRTRYAPRTIDYVPDRYVTRLSASNPPVMHLHPGDTVRTTTLDDNGLDAQGHWGWMPPNTQTGPFYIDGAMPGDTLVVHLKRVRLNQPRAQQTCTGIVSNAYTPDYPRPPAATCDSHWILDDARGVGRPESPPAGLEHFSVPLHPMIGTIGVAPPGGQSITTLDLGSYGGNLDYNRIGEGTTLYFPVYTAGALLSLGDAHAGQGDGEVTGDGLETTMAVEFAVDLIHGHSLGQVWAEDADGVMVSGVGNSLDDSLKLATTGLVTWLKQRYRVDDAGIAMVMGTSVHYDIAEIVDPHPHVVARLPKSVLAQLVAR